MTKPSDDFSDDRFGETAPVAPRVQPRDDALCVVVVAEGIFATHTLPTSGAITIGRSGDVEVLIDDASISRRHVRLHLGATLEIEELGSSNGTVVAGRSLAAGEREPIEIGQVVELGNATIVVQRRRLGQRARRMWSHDYLSGRLQDECLRSARVGGEISLVHVRAPEGTAAVSTEIASELRDLDLMAAYGPDDYQLLLPDTGAERAAEVANRISERLVSIGCLAGLGTATFPAQGRNAEELIAAAVAIARGGAENNEQATVIIVDPTMKQLYTMVDRVAASTINVLLLGETGVGKEVIASRIHERSPREGKPYVCINCGALTETLLESELFGHEKGAFTGAQNTKIGLLEAANGGTVFLDELGEMPLSLQVKLLRVLEQRQVMRVGATSPREIDVRFIAATNRDLEVEVADGGFREDLFYRINGFSLVIPSLRERVADIRPLAEMFARLACTQARLPAIGFSTEAIGLLESYSWPGNIRELRNVVERAVILCAGAEVLAEHLPQERMQGTMVPQRQRAETKGASRRSELHAELEDEERQRIVDALAETGGNQSKAAKLLGISRGTLIARLDKYEIERPRKGRR